MCQPANPRRSLSEPNTPRFRPFPQDPPGDVSRSPPLLRGTGGGCGRLRGSAGGAESATPWSFRTRQLSTTPDSDRHQRPATGTRSALSSTISAPEGSSTRSGVDQCSCMALYRACPVQLSHGAHLDARTRSVSALPCPGAPPFCPMQELSRTPQTRPINALLNVGPDVPGPEKSHGTHLRVVGLNGTCACRERHLSRDLDERIEAPGTFDRRSACVHEGPTVGITASAAVVP